MTSLKHISEMCCNNLSQHNRKVKTLHPLFSQSPLSSLHVDQFHFLLCTFYPIKWHLLYPVQISRYVREWTSFGCPSARPQKLKRTQQTKQNAKQRLCKLVRAVKSERKSCSTKAVPKKKKTKKNTDTNTNTNTNKKEYQNESRIKVHSRSMEWRRRKVCD